jgi:surface antigen
VSHFRFQGWAALAALVVAAFIGTSINAPAASAAHQEHAVSPVAKGVATGNRVSPNMVCCGGGGPLTGVVESNPTLNRRGGPGTGYNIHGTVSYNSRITIACYEWGNSVTATWPDGETYSTQVWDAIADSTGLSFGLYVSDAWINTGGDTSQMVPECNSLAANPSSYPWPNVPPTTYIGDGHGYYEGECVSFAAWEKRSDSLPITKSPDFLGNAYQWTGHTSSSIPHVGDVAQWDPNHNGAGGNGHVAYVHAVYYDSATIEIYEYNWLDSYDNNTGHRLSIRTISWSQPSRYLQF